MPNPPNPTLRTTERMIILPFLLALAAIRCPEKLELARRAAI